MLFYDSETTEAHLKRIEVRLLGTGAAAPTKVLGQGITVTRTGVGVYRLTFAENLGDFRGADGVGMDATTPGSLAGCSVVFTAYNATTRVLDLNLYTIAGAARELAATEFLNFALRFKQSKV